MIDHIAIIPDGNRRWAEQRGLTAQQGHKQGFERTRQIIEQAFKSNVRNLTFWGASINNLTKRSRLEIKHLYQGFDAHLSDLLTYREIHEQKVQVNILGLWEQLFPQPLQRVIRKVIHTTQDYTERKLNFLLGYNGDEEMIQAIQKIVNKARQDSNLTVSSELIKQNLYTKDLPPVDLLIRTGGEPHNSVGFMMWDTANTHYYFTDTYYPDFGMVEFQKAVQAYHSREKRQGK